MTGQSLVPSQSEPGHLAAPGAYAPPPGWGQAPPPPTAGVWQRYLAALRRYVLLIVAITVAGSTAGYFAARYIRPKYEVQSTIWISSETPSPRLAGPIRAEQVLNASSWPELLTSYAILDRAARDVGLHIIPADSASAVTLRDFAVADTFQTGHYEIAATADGREWIVREQRRGEVARGARTDSIGRALGFRWAPDARVLPPGKTVSVEIVTPRDAAVQLRNRLFIMRGQESHLMRLSMNGSDPARDALTLNAVTREFVNVAAALKRRNHTEFAATLEQQLAYAQRELAEAEVQLEGFRASTITLPGEGNAIAGGVELTRDPVLDGYFRQKLSLDSAQHEARVFERTLQEVSRGQTDIAALGVLPGIASVAPQLRASLEEYGRLDTQLRAARVGFTDEHPTIRRLLGSMRTLREQTIPQQAAAALATMRRNVADMDSRVSTATAGIRAIPARTIEEQRLRRNVEVRENLYRTLKSRYEEARLAEASATPDVSVLDSAMAPMTPSANAKPQVIVFGIIGSLGIAIGMAILLDMLDGRVRYPQQVTGDLGLSILGAVPRTSRRTLRRASTAKMAEEAAQLVEAFRGIRLNVNHAYDRARNIALTITSPGVGDGKSLVASNLALSYAAEGRRVLLIDADIRRGELHSIFGLDRTPGLVDVLNGAAQLDDVLHPTFCEGLTFLPAGARLRRGPELVASVAFMELFARLRDRFDTIIVDSAPLGAGSDAYALGVATGEALIVLRTGVTDRRLSRVKLDILDRFPVSVIGAVLNGVEAEGDFSYYSNYLYGYEDGDEDATQVPLSLVGSSAGTRRVG